MAAVTLYVFGDIITLLCYRTCM